jgi:hypothetical protein
VWNCELTDTLSAGVLERWLGSCKSPSRRETVGEELGVSVLRRLGFVSSALFVPLGWCGNRGV